MGKKRHGSGQHGPKSSGNGHGHGSSGTQGVSSGQHTQTNRKRTKLLSKRQLGHLTNVAPPEEYEVVTVVATTSTSTPSSRSMNGDGTPNRRVRSQFMRKSRDEKGKVKGFSLRDEALNTSQHYNQRSWLEDKRSTLRYQPVQFIEAGLLTSQLEQLTITEETDEEESTDSLIDNKPAEPVGEGILSIHMVHHPPSDQSGTLLPNPMAEEQILSTEVSISRSNASSVPSDSISVTKEPPQPSTAIPLPPMQFLLTEENIVFTPRNQRRQTPSETPPTLSNWETPLDLRTVISSSAPTWEKPKKRRGRPAHQRFGDSIPSGQGDVEVVEFGGVEMSITAQDALNDYLENVLAQAEDGSESVEEYLDTVLMEEDKSDDEDEDEDAEKAMRELSLDEQDTTRSRSVETRQLRKVFQKKGALSESATPLRIDSPEIGGPVNSIVDSEVDGLNVVEAVETALDRDEDDEVVPEDQWIMNKVSSDSDTSDQSELDEEEVLQNEESNWYIDEQGDPSHAVASENEIEDEERRSEEAVEDDGDEDYEDDEDDIDSEDALDEDEEIIRQMTLNDYHLEDLLDGTVILTPPLRKSRKSLTRQPNVPTLPDAEEDIPAYLQEMWKKDHQSKREKKREREELRVLGLLGNKSKSKGKKAKRAARQEELLRKENFLETSLTDINIQIREFWEDDSALDFALPPMPRLARKIVHTLAGAYNLSSKSAGAGEMRFTTLFKTSKTTSIELNDRRINSIVRNNDWALRSGDKSGDGRFTPRSSAKKLRDGDIVGADAKELAIDNKGRIMLEKLGWTSGMGLGAEGSGIKLPLQARIKASKSGLQ